MTLTALERECIDAFRSGQAPELTGADINDEDAWVGFGLRLLLDASAVVRDLRLQPMADTAKFKKDGSPYTEQERDIEARMRGQLEQFCPGATFVGEESGGGQGAPAWRGPARG